MGDSSTGINRKSTGGGLSASHPPASGNPARVGTTTTSEQNLVRTALLPVACWRVDDIRFDFDSSFVRPEIGAEIRELANLREQHKKDLGQADGVNPPVTVYPPLGIFGHADPVGTDDYNKSLSGRRAKAIYGLITRNTQLWQVISSQESWGQPAVQLMQQTVSQSSPGVTPAQGGAALFQQYMDAICVLSDSSGQPQSGEDGNPVRFQLKPADFLAQGANSAGKGDYQGCSEFNPVLLFSQEEQTEYEQADNHDLRNQQNAPNRRVMALLFPPGSQVDPDKWPCPSADDGISGCQKRFWSNGENRRSQLLSGQRREFAQTKDTFACRFYQRLVDSSPCEDTRVFDFEYGLQMTADLPWSSSARLRVYSEDGSQEQVFQMSQGQTAGDYLYFTFSQCKPGVRYACEIRDGQVLVSLFPLTELFGLLDPQVEQNTIPLFPPNSLPGQPGYGGGNS
ncbi:MAG: hypothetical protein ABSH24_03465 [Bryobacteraceae bacterium]|jgi:hypothetical protein